MAASFAVDVLHAKNDANQLSLHDRSLPDAETHIAMVMAELMRAYEMSMEHAEHIMWMLRHGMMSEDNVFHAAERVGERRAVVMPPLLT